TDPEAIERGAKHEGITAFIVNMHTPGIESRPIRDIAGDELFNEVWFTDARVPADCRLGEEGQGWQVAMGTLGHERVGTAGLAITMAADLRSMISAAKATNPDALRDPEIRERIARAFTDIEYTKLLNYRALTKIIKGEKNWPEVPLAKLQWSYLAQTPAQRAADRLGPAAPVVTRLPRAHAPWEETAGIDEIARVAVEAERLGYHHITCSEHVALPAAVAETRGATYWDPLPTLGYIAARTTTIRLATHVLVLGYHHPLTIAKRYGTLDRVSGGRLVLGVGVGSLREEFDLLDAEFEGRGDRADDAIRALRASLSELEPAYR